MTLENVGLDAAMQYSKDGGANQPVESSRYPRRTQKIVGGEFDSRKIFEMCKQLGTISSDNATTRSGGVSRDRTMATIKQLGDGIADPRRFAQLTGEEREFNQKKVGEIWFEMAGGDSNKRLFGDSVVAKK